MDSEDKGYVMLIAAAALGVPNQFLPAIQAAVEDEAWSVAILVAGIVVLAIQISVLVIGLVMIKRSH